MRRAAALCSAALVFSSCASVHTDVRTERGPLLGTDTRQQVIPDAGVQASVETKYPTLTVRFSRFDLCRTEQVARYAEQRITEKSAPEAGPAIATGLPTVAIGLGLLLARGLFSDAPNTGHLDASGHYGASDRKVATTWSIALLAIGAPAIITGAVQMAQTGVSTATRKVEQVTDQSDAPCHPVAAAGNAQLVPPSGVGPTFAAPGGVLSLSADQVRGHPIDTFILDGAPVTVDPESAKRLDAFEACTEVLPGPSALGEVSSDALERTGALAKSCDALPEQPAKALADAVAAEVQRREAAQPRAPEVQSFDQALQQYPPSVTLTPDSPDLAKLDAPESLQGQSVLLRGIVSQQVSPNIVVVKVGQHPVLVLLQPEALWNASFPIGARVEAVAIGAGTQRLGELSAPLLRAIWMRPAFVEMTPDVPPENPPSDAAP